MLKVLQHVGLVRPPRLLGAHDRSSQLLAMKFLTWTGDEKLAEIGPVDFLGVRAPEVTPDETHLKASRESPKDAAIQIGEESSGLYIVHGDGWQEERKESFGFTGRRTVQLDRAGENVAPSSTNGHEAGTLADTKERVSDDLDVSASKKAQDGSPFFERETSGAEDEAEVVQIRLVGVDLVKLPLGSMSDEMHIDDLSDHLKRFQRGSLGPVLAHPDAVLPTSFFPLQDEGLSATFLSLRIRRSQALEVVNRVADYLVTDGMHLAQDPS